MLVSKEKVNPFGGEQRVNRTIVSECCKNVTLFSNREKYQEIIFNIFIHEYLSILLRWKEGEYLTAPQAALGRRLLKT